MGPIKTLHLATLAFFFAYGLTVPTLPLYLKELGLAPGEVGLAVALMPLAGLLLRPFGGWLTDAKGRKPPALLGLLTSLLAGLFYLGPLPLVLLGRFLQGLGMALFAPSTLAQTSDLAPEEALGRTMGTRNLVIGLGVMLGTAVGGLVYDLYGAKGVFSLYLALHLPWFLPLLRLPETLSSPRLEPWWQGFLAALKIPGVQAATWANTGFAAVFSMLQAYYPLFLTQAGLGASLVGVFFGFYSLVSVAARLPAGAILDRQNPYRVATFGFIVATAGIFLLWAFPLPPLALVAGVVMGLGSGFYLPANVVAVTKATPPNLRGAAFSLFTASWDAGGLLGPPLAGAAVEWVGLSAFFPLAALVAVFTTLVYLRLARRVL